MSLRKLCGRKWTIYLDMWLLSTQSCRREGSRTGLAGRLERYLGYGGEYRQSGLDICTRVSQVVSNECMYTVSSDNPESQHSAYVHLRNHIYLESHRPIHRVSVESVSCQAAHKRIYMNVHSLQQHLKPDKSPKTPNLDTQTSPSNGSPPNSSSDHDPRKLRRTEVIPSKQCQAKVSADDL